ncbi:Basic-leucine zipper (BZIP) transcription factor family protein [Thalictrum thalictroides]|uniref:Basic-leucine zipper (BZIP) transcription factor family protein n=1 Tax=Thalictrum thalictroides TaxID=46969 RepID=A0A7J6WSB8_THATH|nr:Basic-leucine zipper (BZIP) transcription factor family protein [Thalictrum thalictroides]
MANSKGSSNFRNVPYAGRQSLLPPRSPFPSISPSYVDYGSSSGVGAKGAQKPKEGYRHHQRTSSESFLIEEQPSWVEELLDEPDTPVRKGHRRSSSDSYAYLDAANASNIFNTFQEEYKFNNVRSGPSRVSQDFEFYKDSRHASFYQEPNSFGKHRNRAWESSLRSATYQANLLSGNDNVGVQSSGPLGASREPDGIPSTTSGRHDFEESAPYDLKGFADRRDCSQNKPATETDPKRAKQQFAQRSRVRKLQYIAELERNVEVLQTEGTEVTAEIEFLDQQNLILNMQNKALKQRLDSLSQEHVIKRLEQEMLEREIARLQALHQQQQQQPQQPLTHRRVRSRDLDSQFANLSLKHKEASSGHDTVSGPLHI